MAQFKITGGKKLAGEIRVVGNKNSTFPLMAAALLVDGPVTFTNVPKIRDVQVLGQIIENLGAKVTGLGTDTITIDGTHLSSWKPDPVLTGKLRGSVVLIASLLARFKKAEIVSPGGDSIGERLLDTHFELLTALGVDIKAQNGVFKIDGSKIKAGSVFLEEASVTATEIGIILGATLPGQTIIEDAASEPHVQDLVDFLNKSGAKISGGGTNTLEIDGVDKLTGISHSIRPDYIEAGTFAIAAAITGGTVNITNIEEEDLKMALRFLSRMGVAYELENNQLKILSSNLVAKRKTFKTRTWPGFSTDLMSPFIVLATQTKGSVLCHDWMYEWRIFFVDHLIKMGADITIADPHRVIVHGPTRLHGELIPTSDIRAGIALVLAALCAEGESIVEHAEIIERGYEDLDGRLRKIGAEIERIK